MNAQFGPDAQLDEAGQPDHLPGVHLVGRGPRTTRRPGRDSRTERLDSCAVAMPRSTGDDLRDVEQAYSSLFDTTQCQSMTASRNRCKNSAPPTIERLSRSTG